MHSSKAENIDLLKLYFPELSQSMQEKLLEFIEQIYFWNQKLNLVSKKAAENLVIDHLIPCLVFKKVFDLESITKGSLLDIGTGGGFPGLVLAICYPHLQCTLIDSIGKKIQAVQSIAESLNLQNVQAQQIRVEQLKNTFDVVTGRAVTNLPDFLTWSLPKIKKTGIIAYLKGGPLETHWHNQKIKATHQYYLDDMLHQKNHLNDTEILKYEQKYILTFRGKELLKLWNLNRTQHS